MISNFLFSKTNREFLIFLFFFALAGVFWLLMTLNETYEQEVKIPVQYTNVPKNTVLTSGETDTMRVTVSDKGIILAAYIFGKSLQPVKIDFKNYAKTGGMGYVPQAELKRLATQQLMASSKIVSVKPDRMLFYYNNGEKKRVPVQYSGQVLPSELYYLAKVIYQPDSITIFASREKLDSINTVYTQKLDYSDVRDTLYVHAPLRRIAGVKMIPEAVDILFCTDILSEMVVNDIPIIGINMPEGKVLRTFPAKVSVRFVAGMSQYRHLTNNDFEVVADYNEVRDNPSPKCNIHLRSMPEGITRVHLDTTQVEYLIEE
jgi:YbbR domain-containing protein